MTYVGAVRAALAGAGDPVRAAGQQAYMKSEMPYVGLTAPALKALLEPLLVEHRFVDRAAFELGSGAELPEVLVTEGLLGDILSDLAAGRAGSPALCGSASIHPGAPARGRCRAEGAGAVKPVGWALVGLALAGGLGALAWEWAGDRPAGPVAAAAASRASTRR